MAEKFDHTVSIKSLVDNFDRWTEETDQSTVPPYILALISTPSRDLQLSSPHRIQLDNTLLDVLEAFKKERNVIFTLPNGTTDTDKQPNELVCGRLSFVERAFAASSLLDSFSTVAGTVSCLDTVYGHETLDVVLHRMLTSPFEEVCIKDGGIVIGVLHIDEIFNFLSKELTLLGCELIGKHAVVVDSREEGEDQELTVQSSSEIKESMEKKRQECQMTPLQQSARQFCRGYWTEILLIICILLDVTASIYEYSTTPADFEGVNLDQERLQVATGIILFVFAYEACVRIFGFRQALLRLPFELIDLAIVAVSVIVYSLVIRDMVTSDSKTIMTLTRIIRGLRMFKVVKLIVDLVMKQQMMYNKDGFSLDLSFVTPSCLVMSMPFMGSKVNFANPIEEVERFFDTKFPDRYTIFNLCSEPSYGDERFRGRIEHLAVDKNHPPRFAQLVSFVERAALIMDEDPKACLALHCSSGRDRTGVMVSAWLLYSTFADSADDAMAWFAAKRVGRRAARPADGIAHVGQQRYVRYMEVALRQGGFHTKRLVLTQVVVRTCPRMDALGGCSLWVAVLEDGREVGCSLGGDGGAGPVAVAAGDEKTALAVRALVAGDVRVRVYNRDPASGRDELCCFLCCHTGFVDGPVAVFDKAAVDVAETDARCRVFAAGFALELHFEHVPAKGEAVPPHAARGGTALGPFRKIAQPSRRVTEAAVRARGRDLTVQQKQALRLDKKVLASKSFSGRSSLALGGAAADEPPNDALVCAEGPVVRHDSVCCYRRDGAGAPSAKSWTLSNSYGAKIARSLVRAAPRPARTARCAGPPAAAAPPAMLVLGGETWAGWGGGRSGTGPHQGRARPKAVGGTRRRAQAAPHAAGATRRR